jgi:hypothetical protein
MLTIRLSGAKTKKDNQFEDTMDAHLKDRVPFG